MTITSTAKKVVSVATAAHTAYTLLVKVTGEPVRDKGKPATVTIGGLPVFDRDADGVQHLFHWFRIRDARK